MTLSRYLFALLLLVASMQAQVLFQTSTGTAQAQVATPTFDHDTATYSNDTAVTISDATGGAAIAYCTGAGADCSPGTSYTVAVTISADATHLCAKATHAAMTDSATKCATYTLTVATPTFSPVAGAVANPTTVTASSTTTGNTMLADQSNPPTTATATFSVTSAGTWYAKATKSNYNASTVGSAAYTITAGPTTYAADTFAGTVGTNLASHTTTTGGLSWANVTGGSAAELTGSSAVKGTASNAEYAVNYTATADYCVSVKFKVNDASNTNARPGDVILRQGDPTGANTGYWCGIILDWPARYGCMRRDSAYGFTTLITDSTDTPANNDVVKACVAGSTNPVVTLTVNGVSRGTYTDTGAPSYFYTGKPALHMALAVIEFSEFLLESNP